MLIVNTITINAQRKSRADRFFEKGDYINAALFYEEDLNNEGYSKHVLKNISTSYYNTFQFKKAYRYLSILTLGKYYEKDKTYDNAFNFMMYQTLSSLGKYESAVSYLALYKKNKDAIEINKSDAIEEIEAFKLKDDDYTIDFLEFNSDASEFGAIKRDSIIYYTSDRSINTINGLLDKNYKWTHRPFLDIYKVTVDENNKSQGEIEDISKEINSKLHEGNFCFSSDGNTIYFSKSNSEKGKKKFDSIQNNAIHLYKSIQQDGQWQTPEKLPFNNISYSIEHPTLSADNTTLYIASNKPGGHGDFDIYSIAIASDGTYGDLINLGPVINTENREQFPFITDAGHLFFSSNGHLGMGMMDIFVSENKNGSLSKPINLGAPINSGYDDFSIHYYNKTDGFFASNRKNKADDDIYSFSQIGEIFPKEYIALFEVKDFSTEDHIPNANVVLFDKDKNQMYQGVTATFELSILAGKYSFEASANGYESIIKPILVKEKTNEKYVIYLTKKKEEIVNSPTEDNKTGTNSPLANTPDTKQNTDINAPADSISMNSDGVKPPSKEDIKKTLLSDTEGPAVIEKNGKLYFELPPIYFDYNKWNIREDSKKVLDELALKLEKYKTVYITISSHTDSRGTESYNQILSEKRAESTRNYLALVGYVNARRMKFIGFGEFKPLIQCIDDGSCSEEQHQTNRRSEFEIVKY